MRTVAMEEKVTLSRKLKLQRLVSNTVADENRRVISALNEMVTNDEQDTETMLDADSPTRVRMLAC